MSLALKSSGEVGGISGRRVSFPIVSTEGAPWRAETSTATACPRCEAAHDAAKPGVQPVALRPAALPSAFTPAPPGLVSPVSPARFRVRRPRRACSRRQSATGAGAAEAEVLPPVYDCESHDEDYTLFVHVGVQLSLSCY